MVSSIPFTEPKIRALKPPTSTDVNARDFYKDTKFPGLQLAVYPTGAKVYYYVRRIDGKPTRVRLGTADQLSVDQARTAAKIRAGKVAAGENPQADRAGRLRGKTLQKLFDYWMIYARAHKKPRSIEEDKRNYRLHLSPWANRKLATITKGDVQDLHSKMGTENGIYAANRTLALLRAMFNKAEDLGYRGANPAARVKMFREAPRDRFLQPGELEAFFKALEAEPDLFRDFFLTSLLTGARKSNVLAMQWSELLLDENAGFWRIPETKADMPVVLPLPAPLVTILTARRKAAQGSPWVFPGHRKGTHLRTPQGAWERIVKRSKLRGLRIHDLRRSLGSWMAGNNVSLTIVGKVLGHKTPQATAIYARLAIDPQRHAMEGATTAMLTAGKQTKLLTVDVESKEAGDDEKA
jgi:integrase